MCFLYCSILSPESQYLVQDLMGTKWFEGLEKLNYIMSKIVFSFDQSFILSLRNVRFPELGAS